MNRGRGVLRAVPRRQETPTILHSIDFRGKRPRLQRMGIPMKIAAVQPRAFPSGFRIILSFRSSLSIRDTCAICGKTRHSFRRGKRELHQKSLRPTLRR